MDGWATWTYLCISKASLSLKPRTIYLAYFITVAVWCTYSTESAGAIFPTLQFICEALRSCVRGLSESGVVNQESCS
ncbi:hypothetical protein PISMIDRAFT_510978 [Pisolithus microcarpus 441]|uniref:Uncharacterized protein n=1 Tax=Pisolithus microcarpus 441 TaxID=765257 RepID=A0A0C9YBT8_9AGAM|nr:hypothetical protein BKA83DRAFT_510978 [Pisolithus microcarpus]KIK22220.1 hypothetical protein PISMIDRAFT_510978 [Pisolithus microcarpus 441]